MRSRSELFIKRGDRPDLRAAMTDGDEPTVTDWQVLSSPILYLPLDKDCSGDKSDKGDKKKEIGKDDKNARNAAGAPAGPVKDISQRVWQEDGQPAELRDAIDQTVFS